MLLIVLWVGVGSALGGAARYGLSEWVRGRSHGRFPWATFAINLTGAFAIGLFFGWAGTGWEPHAAPPEHIVLTYGVLGGFTTVSTYSLETLMLIKEGRRRLALAYAAGTLLVCLVAVDAGWALGAAF
jgi:fluoride exporter